jgi:predicted DNA-binding protein
MSDLNNPEASAVLANSRITINLSAELHAVLRKLAGEEGRSVSNLCRQLIESAITQRQRRN